VIITDTSLSGVTGVAISDTATTLDANRSYASRQKQRALAWSGGKKDTGDRKATPVAVFAVSDASSIAV
jgi:hypothetical protein